MPAAQPTPSATARPSTQESDFTVTLRRWAPVIVVSWVMLNFAWTLSFGFTNDDFIWIEHADPSSAAGWRQLILAPLASGVFFRPLVQLSFVLNYITSGLHPLGYHLLNVGLHAANAWMVWQLALSVVVSPAVALLTSLVFAVHPITSDAVTWVSGRTEVIGTFFYLAAILMRLKGRRATALALYAFALCSKESTISLPLVVLIADRLQLGSAKRTLSGLAPYVAITALYLLLRKALLDQVAWGMLGGPGVPLRWGLVGFLVRSKITLLAAYLLAPLPLHWGLELSRAASGNFVGLFPTQALIRSCAALVLGGFVVFLCGRAAPLTRRRAILFAIGWMSSTLLPFLPWRQLMPWYMYLPIIGTSLLLPLLGMRAVRIPSQYRRPAGAVAVVIWLGASVALLQTSNNYERRAGLATREVVEAVASAVPSPAHNTVFVVFGMDLLRSGADPRFQRAVLGFGLPEAVRLRFQDRSLGAVFNRSVPSELARTHPLVFLVWNEHSKSFQRLPPSQL